VCAYLDQARLKPTWEPAVPEARDRLLLTERRHPLTKNSLALLFKRLSQRAGFTRAPICPSMLRDTYAIRFLQAGGELAALQEQLGVACLASVKRYQHFCERRKEEREAQACPEGRCPNGVISLEDNCQKAELSLSLLDAPLKRDKIKNPRTRFLVERCRQS
jgi:site-specific recombinase XerD